MKKILMFACCALLLPSCNFAEVMGELVDGTTGREAGEAQRALMASPQMRAIQNAFMSDGSSDDYANKHYQQMMEVQSLRDAGKLR